MDGQAAETESTSTADPVEEQRERIGRPSANLWDQLEQLGGQIRSLQEEVQELAARRSDVIGDQAGQRVTAILQAAEESAADIAAQAHKDAAELRERVLAEAEADAEHIRIDAQGEAKTIHTEAHAAAARLRDETLAALRGEVDRICEQLAADLRDSAHEALDAVAAGQTPVSEEHDIQEPDAPPIEVEEADVSVEEAVDELQSAAAVLEQSLRHLQEIGEGLPDSQ